MSPIQLGSLMKRFICNVASCGARSVTPVSHGLDRMLLKKNDFYIIRVSKKRKKENTSRVDERAQV